MTAADGDPIERAHDLFERARWRECLAVLSAAAAEAPLEPADVELMSRTAFLVGREDESIAISEQGYARFEAAGDERWMARCALGLAFVLDARGDYARSGAWAARARRLVESAGLGGSEAGHLVAYEAHALLARGHPDEAADQAARAVELGQESGDADVVVLGRLTLAWWHLGAGRRAEAMAEFDEIMLCIGTNRTTPIVTGMAYCGLIRACMRVRDLQRATEWTRVLSTWCADRPDLVPYRGTCLVHRAQILTMQGLWPAAVGEATAACERLPERQAGDAWYQLGDVHRMSGRYAEAEADFRRASRAGRQPEPGLARLRMAQGRADAAVLALRSCLAERQTVEDRAELLGALTEALLAVGDAASAGSPVAELTGIASSLDAPLVSAQSAQALGLLELARGEAATALVVLRDAWRLWHELDLPYEAARARVAIARCLQELADEDSAGLELDAAREVFERLGAQPDLETVEAMGATTHGTPGGLTAREVQVIRLVAEGRTNRAIAAELFVSEKTVARHLSNIFTKLDVASRSAATAYAYDHGLV